MSNIVFFSLSMPLQALLESAFLTFAPLLLLSGDENGKGVVTSTFDYGTATFALVVLQVSFKVGCRLTPVRAPSHSSNVSQR